MHCLYIIFLSFFLFISHCLSQDDQQKILEKTRIPDPMKLRDPFKPPKLKKVNKNSKTGLVKNGVFTNIPSPENVTLDNILVLGVLLGKNRRAIAKLKDGDSNTFMLHEGLKINEGKIELKAILPGGVIFVEKLTNIYGQTEYLETVIPISE
jgi:type IV pilus assembly protein PilP